MRRARDASGNPSQKIEETLLKSRWRISLGLDGLVVVYNYLVDCSDESLTHLSRARALLHCVERLRSSGYENVKEFCESKLLKTADSIRRKYAEKYATTGQDRVREEVLREKKLIELVLHVALRMDLLGKEEADKAATKEVVSLLQNASVLLVAHAQTDWQELIDYVYETFHARSPSTIERVFDKLEVESSAMKALRKEEERGSDDLGDEDDTLVPRDKKKLKQQLAVVAASDSDKDREKTDLAKSAMVQKKAQAQQSAAARLGSLRQQDKKNAAKTKPNAAKNNSMLMVAQKIEARAKK